MTVTNESNLDIPDWDILERQFSGGNNNFDNGNGDNDGGGDEGEPSEPNRTPAGAAEAGLGCVIGAAGGLVVCISGLSPLSNTTIEVPPKTIAKEKFESGFSGPEMGVILIPAVAFAAIGAAIGLIKARRQSH